MSYLIAVSYRPSYDDYCCNCLMGTYHSNFEVSTGLEDDVLKQLAEMDISVTPPERPYQHHFIINVLRKGYLVEEDGGTIHGQNRLWDDADDIIGGDDEDDAFDQAIQTIRLECHRLREKLNEYRTQAKKEQQIRLQQAAKAKSERIRQQIQEKELAQLAALKEKYPDEAK